MSAAIRIGWVTKLEEFERLQCAIDKVSNPFTTRQSTESLHYPTVHGTETLYEQTSQSKYRLAEREHAMASDGSARTRSPEFFFACPP